MEDFLLALLVLGFIWLYIRQHALKRRIQKLESFHTRPAAPLPSLASIPVAAPPPAATSTPAPAAAPAPTAAPTAPYRAPSLAPPLAPPLAPRPALPPVPPRSVPPPRPRVSLEARLGQNWLNKLGIVTLVIGVALYLGFQLQHVGPLGKDLVGFTVALAILALGLFLEPRPNYRLFARTCIGGAWALLFFLTFALGHVPALQVLHSLTLDLLLMFAVAAGMVAHSLRYHSQTVTTLAFLLAFLTVGLSHVTLFSLVAGTLLAAALSVVVYRERWFALGLCGVVAVYLNHFLWLRQVLPHGGVPNHPFPDFLSSAALLLAYWLLFRLVYVFRAPLPGPAYRSQQGLASFAAILNSIGLLALLKYQSARPEWAFPALLTLGAAELLFAHLARGTYSNPANDTPTVPRNRPAFIVLSTLAACLLLAAVPFKFRGAPLPLLWLLEAEAFFIVGIRLPEIVFRRLGILASSLTAVYLAYGGLLLLISQSGSATVVLTAPVTPTNTALTLLVAALLLWLNATFLPRRFAWITVPAFDRMALRADGYAAALLALIGLTLALHTAFAWTAVAWLSLALLLAFLADRLTSADLATQSDLLAAAALLRILFLNLQLPPHHSLQLLTTSAFVALLYAALFRRTRSFLLPTHLLPAAYTWAAAVLIALLCWYQLEPLAIAVAWGVSALVLFELGLTLQKPFLRHQAYALLTAAFIRIFFANLHIAHPAGTLSPSLTTVLPLIAAFAWVYERAHRGDALTRLDRRAASLLAAAATLAAAALLYFELRPDWVILGWTILALALLALATTLHRNLFLALSLAVVLAVALRAVFFQLFTTAPLAATFLTSRTFTISLTAALLLLALPLAFRLRAHSTSPAAAPTDLPVMPGGKLRLLLLHPEQSYFFTPLALLTLLLFVQLQGALITIGWVVLGLVTFLFALTVKERTFRLAGLALLLLGVAKVLLWDVWHAAPAERYLTLIVMGAALLLVSFLYSRYRDTLLKFL